MRRLYLASFVVVAFGGILAAAFLARAEDRKAAPKAAQPKQAEAKPETPEAILAAIDAIKLPDPENLDQNNPDEMLKFIQAATRRAELIGDLLKADPVNDKLGTLLPERWQILYLSRKAEVPAITAEIDKYIGETKDQALKAEAAFIKVVLLFKSRTGSLEGLIGAADAFQKIAPKDDRGAMILASIGQSLSDPARQVELFRRVQAEYPDSPYVDMVKGDLKRLDSIGKPFELAFTDAISGKEVAMKDLRGKVVVLDFWATWCGPCVAEMPNLKKLYAEYKDQGVEFIGISLDAPKDEGGLDKLKSFVARNGIEWPQYYQGNGWDSEFSGSWGITAIPAMFVVDAAGNLHSVDARGRLEEMIPDLLKRAKKGEGAH